MAAMRDTMGQGAALTGGYGSSYSQQAGQQAYDAYLTKLADEVPELYDRAYQMYKDDGDRALQAYGLLEDREEKAYGRYRDDYDRFVKERSWAQDQADRELELQGQNLSKLQGLMALGYQPTDQEIADAGLTPDQYMAIMAAYQQPAAAAGTGYGDTWAERNAYYGYENGKGMSKHEIADIQRRLGMENPDGVWGPKTEAAYLKWLEDQQKAENQSSSNSSARKKGSGAGSGGSTKNN